MTSGFVAFADGHVFVMIPRGGLGVKLTGAHFAQALQREGSQRMCHAANRPASRRYVVFKDDDLSDDDFMTAGLEIAAAGAIASPRRPPRRR